MIDNSREKNVEHLLERYCLRKGIYLERIRTTGISTAHGLIPDIKGKGRVDFIGCYLGFFIGFETKSRTGKLKPRQELNKKIIVAAKGKHYVIRSEEDIQSLDNDLKSLHQIAEKMGLI